MLLFILSYCDLYQPNSLYSNPKYQIELNILNKQFQIISSYKHLINKKLHIFKRLYYSYPRQQQFPLFTQFMRTHQQTFSYQKNSKDLQIITNTCPSESNCIKNVMGKFFRKQDAGKIEKKKKTQQQENSLLCYLTPKNCDQSAKFIRQKMKQCYSSADMHSFLGNSINEQQNPHEQNVSKTKQYFRAKQRSEQTSLEKHNLSTKTQNKFIINMNKQKISAEVYQGSKRPNSPTATNSSFNYLKNKDYIKQESKSNLAVTNSDQAISEKKQTYTSIKDEKQIKKLKNQCQHFNSLLQTSNKLKSQLTVKNKELQKQIKQMKLKNAKTTSEKEKQLLEIKEKFNKLQCQNKKISSENQKYKDEKYKLEQQILYLKGTVQELNERINELLKGGIYNFSSQLDISSSNPKGTRFNSLCATANVTSRLFTSNHQHNFIDQNQMKLVHQLQNQLRYCQVQINMLKRVKLDINKKNQQFIKLQRQNKLLKNQIFDIKTSGMIDDQVNKSTKQASRNNFQINSQRGNRGNQCDRKSQSCSSQSLSLNLSLSPEKRNRKQY